MKRVVVLLVCGWLTSIMVQAAEMTGSYYAVEISVISGGGGVAADGGAAQTIWGATAQPLAQGRCSGGGYHLFSGVYTPVVPETAVALPALLGLTLARRRR